MSFLFLYSAANPNKASSKSVIYWESQLTIKMSCRKGSSRWENVIKLHYCDISCLHRWSFCSFSMDWKAFMFAWKWCWNNRLSEYFFMLPWARCYSLTTTRVWTPSIKFWNGRKKLCLQPHSSSHPRCLFCRVMTLKANIFFIYATMKLCNEPNGAGEHKANMDFFLQFFPSHCSRYCKMFYKINLKWKMGGEVVEWVVAGLNDWAFDIITRLLEDAKA